MKGSIRIFNSQAGFNEQIASILPTTKAKRIAEAMTVIDDYCLENAKQLVLIHADDTQSDFVAAVKDKISI